MKSILKWLQSKFSRHVDTVEAEEHHTPSESESRLKRTSKKNIPLKSGSTKKRRRSQNSPFSVIRRSMSLSQETSIDVTDKRQYGGIFVQRIGIEQDRSPRAG